MSFFDIIRRKPPTVMAAFMPTPNVIEVSFVASLGAASFVIVGPVVTTYLGSYFAGCSMSACTAGGFAAGSSVSAASIGNGTLIYTIRYKKWLKDNALKYIVNSLGKLEMIPFAFITTRTTTINPLTLIILTNSYCFLKGYIKKRNEITEQLADVDI